MERKFADFRARRQAKRLSSKEPSAPAAPNTNVCATPAGTPQTEQKSDPNPPEEGARDWMLDTSWGRWLSTRKYDLSNITLLKVLLWVVLLGFFVELEFGLAFFVVSLFYWLYEGLRDPDEREPGEMSAYSVFNPDCQPLLGALTAEQMEAEMGYRALANR
ncbi:SAYSvFN domain-containing protein 1 isoform X1 [Phycodurus eques]|uniref:SAYSvFN domain-containing protein 1 isoform X1 n=1 Tax=Phycodurus eques TaxID=693459 RepID=UPI002ACEFFEC|nr:SAYSvFN domain-containing protein 1 isoform X1 [Phycodurus eques]